MCANTGVRGRVEVIEEVLTGIALGGGGRVAETKKKEFGILCFPLDWRKLVRSPSNRIIREYPLREV